MTPYIVAFHRWSKYTHNRFLKIWKGSGDLSYAWKKSTLNDLLSWGLEEEIARTFLEERKRIDPIEEQEKLDKLQIHLLTIQDGQYPALLKEISDPPVILYVAGDVSLLSGACLAVVGTRLMSAYGKQVIEYIIPGLTHAGLVIVSGLALGVDAYAHKVTLQNKGKTIAVLGSGLDVVYPVQNKKLGEEIIASGGAVLSEMPLGSPPTAYSFPVRNRIISGLSRGTLVIEAKESSGSLITAHSALDQNRDVFAVAGNMFASNMEGTHNLIKSGEAKLVTKAEDILSELGFATDEKSEEQKNVILENEHEKRVYDLLSQEPLFVDHLIQESELSSSDVTAILTILEMKGYVKNMGGMMWVKC
jgi:DNA processing protein